MVQSYVKACCVLLYFLKYQITFEFPKCVLKCTEKKKVLNNVQSFFKVNDTKHTKNAYVCLLLAILDLVSIINYPGER